MYGDQFGEFVCGYWGLKGYGNLWRPVWTICKWILGLKGLNN